MLSVIHLHQSDVQVNAQGEKYIVIHKDGQRLTLIIPKGGLS